MIFSSVLFNSFTQVLNGVVYQLIYFVTRPIIIHYGHTVCHLRMIKHKTLLCRPAGRLKILGGQPKNVRIFVNLYPIFKILFSSESCRQGKLLGGQAAPLPPQFRRPCFVADLVEVVNL